MALSDPFSTTYQGSFQAGQSLGQGIGSAVQDVTSQLEKNKKIDNMKNMLHQFGIMKTEDPDVSEYEKTLAEHAKQIGINNLQVEGSSNPEERKNQIKSIFKQFGIQPPQGSSKIDVDKAAKLGVSFDQEGNMQFSPKQKDLSSLAMREQTMEERKTRLQQQASNQQDRVEQNAIQRLSALRGDQSLARIENQRDASIMAYNTIDGIKKEGRTPTQIEYYDILGQLWKARSGAAPTDQAIIDLDAKTFKGNMAKMVQYFTGKPAGVTTEEILDNVQEFVKNTGEQADKLHEGYMKPHLIKPKGLDEDRWNNIKDQTRGTSFKDATSSMLNQTGLSSGEPPMSMKDGSSQKSNKDFQSYMKAIGQ